VASGETATDLAERWSTEAIFLDRSIEFDYMVFLPKEILPTVKWAGEYLHLV